MQTTDNRGPRLGTLNTFVGYLFYNVSEIDSHLDKPLKRWMGGKISGIWTLSYDEKRFLSPSAFHRFIALHLNDQILTTDLCPHCIRAELTILSDGAAIESWELAKTLFVPCVCTLVGTLVDWRRRSQRRAHMRRIPRKSDDLEPQSGDNLRSLQVSSF